MRIKLLFLMLIVLLALAGPVSAELIVNGDFSDNFNGWNNYGSGMGGDCGGWSSNYQAFLMPTDGSDGGQYVNMDLEGWNCTSYVYTNITRDEFLNPEGDPAPAPVPPIPAAVGDVFNFSAQLRDQITGSQLIIGYYFFDEAGIRIDMDNSGVINNDDRFDFDLDVPSTSWEKVTHEFTVPASLDGTLVASMDFGMWIWGGSNLDIDQISLINGLAHLVHDPIPSNGAQGINPATSQLSWERSRSDSCPDANSMVEVWWGEQAEPNFWYLPGEAVKIMDLADVDTFDLANANGGAITLDPDKVYYWALKYDPNACDDGDDLVEGPGWSFDTINRPPTVDAGLHYDRWQNASADPVVIPIEASYTDDGLPVGGNLTYAWTETLSGGATVPTYPDGRDVEDPNISFSDTGEYLLKLTIHDNEGGAQDKVGESTTLVRIFGNGDDRLRAHYELNGNALDSAESHDGTLEDNPTYGTGQIGLAVELDGTDDVGGDGLNDHVSIGDTGSDPNFQSDTWENSDLIDGFTVSAWMKLDENGWSTTWEAIVAKNNSSWELQRNGGSDNLRFVIQNGIGEATSSGATDVEIGWHQVVGVYDRNTIKIYVDGLESGSGDAGLLDLEAESNFDYLGQQINDQEWQITKAAGKIRIGAGSNVGNDLAFAGLLDQVRIFDAAVPYRAEHAGTPGIVEMYRADGGHDNCGGVYMIGDVNEDCYITLADFALVFGDWLDCNDVAEENCPLSHHTQ